MNPTSWLTLAAGVTFTQPLEDKYAIRTIYEHIPAGGLLALLSVFGVVKLVLVLALGNPPQLGKLGLLLVGRLLLPLSLFCHIPEKEKVMTLKSGAHLTLLYRVRHLLANLGLIDLTLIWSVPPSA